MNGKTAGSGLIIRPIREDEREEVLEVYRQCEDFLALGPQAKASMEMVLSDLRLSQDMSGIFCGIYEAGEAGDGKMIGVLDYVPGGYEGKAEHAYLSLLMIAAPYRSKGFGREVVQWLEESIAGRGEVQALLAGVQANNPRAIRFWQRTGFQITGGPEQMPDTTLAYSLMKPLRREPSPGEEGGQAGE